MVPQKLGIIPSFELASVHPTGFSLARVDFPSSFPDAIPPFHHDFTFPFFTRLLSTLTTATTHIDIA